MSRKGIDNDAESRFFEKLDRKIEREKVDAEKVIEPREADIIKKKKEEEVTSAELEGYSPREFFVGLETRKKKLIALRKKVFQAKENLIKLVYIHREKKNLKEAIETAIYDYSVEELKKNQKKYEGDLEHADELVRISEEVMKDADKSIAKMELEVLRLERSTDEKKNFDAFTNFK